MSWRYTVALLMLFTFAPVLVAQDDSPGPELEYFENPTNEEARAKLLNRKLPVNLKPVTESMRAPRLTFLAGPHKDEMRVDLRQFGLRPTAVLIAGILPLSGTTESRDTHDKGLAAAIAAAEKLAAGWAKQGVETLLLFKEYQGPTKEDGPIKSAKLKHLSIAVVEEWLLCPQVPGLVMQWIDLRDLSKTSDAAARLEEQACWTQWMWMPEPGRVEAIGGSWSDKRLDKLAEDAADKLKPLARDKRVAKVLEQIAMLQIDKAIKGIEKLAAEADSKRPSEEVMGALTERLLSLEQLQRRVLVREHELKGFVVEKVEQLEALGLSFAGHAIAERIAEEVAVLKATDRYARDSRAKPEYERLNKQINEVDAPMNSSNETPQEHYRKIFKAYKHLKSPLAKFLEEHGESVYARELRDWHATICTAEQHSHD